MVLRHCTGPNELNCVGYLGYSLDILGKGTSFQYSVKCPVTLGYSVTT